MSPDQMQVHYTEVEGEATVSVYIPGHGLLTRTSAQPNFREIVRRAMLHDETVVELFDVEKTVADKFRDLSERVSVANGRIYFDRDEVDSSLTKHVLRLLNEGGDFSPWVLFMEKLYENPQKESIEMLFDFTQAADISITPTGMLVAYKGVEQKDDGVFYSLNSGTAIVEDDQGQMVTVTGQIPYRVGRTVEMPRNDVAFDPNTACSTGLHVATWNFAQSYGRNGAILRVHVHPRDVVSVPRDASGEKVRVSRLFVDSIAQAPDKTALSGWTPSDYEDDVEDIDNDPFWTDDELTDPWEDTPTAADPGIPELGHPEDQKRKGGLFGWLKGDK